MHHNQSTQSEYTGHCGPMGRGKFGGSWSRGKFGNFRERFANRFSQPPVNIEETDEAYTISLFAAGLAKANVTLTVKDDVLTVAYPGLANGVDPAANSDSAPNFTYQEYSQGAFERSFRLNNKVLTDSISASYTDGILTILLPKNPATNMPTQTITVA